MSVSISSSRHVSPLGWLVEHPLQSFGHFLDDLGLLLRGGSFTGDAELLTKGMTRLLLWCTGEEMPRACGYERVHKCNLRSAVSKV